MSIVAAGEELPDFTVVYSNGKRRADRRAVADIRKSAMVKQIAILRHMIPSNADKFR